jgi:hypothetical protein
MVWVFFVFLLDFISDRVSLSGQRAEHDTRGTRVMTWGYARMWYWWIYYIYFIYIYTYVILINILYIFSIYTYVILINILYMYTYIHLYDTDIHQDSRSLFTSDRVLVGLFLPVIGLFLRTVGLFSIHHWLKYLAYLRYATGLARLFWRTVGLFWRSMGLFWLLT